MGNFIGDFVKGKDLHNYEELITIGIQVHREIDFFTDNHELVRQSTKRLRADYRHYSGVIVDMFYDHFLAIHFQDYASISLEAFTNNAYKLLEQNIDLFPPKAQNMLPYMIRGNWLMNYKHLGGIHRSLQGISRRTKFDVQLHLAVQDLQKHFHLYEAEFKAFFPQIMEHISVFREDLINSKL